MSKCNEFMPCTCGCEKPEVVEGWDIVYARCPNCGKSTSHIFGDYYDEAFMWATYGDAVIREWNRMVGA